MLIQRMNQSCYMLMRVANPVHKEIFETKYHFDGSLCDEQ